MARHDLSIAALLVSWLFLLGIGLTSQSPFALADPHIDDLENGNRTAVWDFANPSAYLLTNVEIGTQEVSLSRLTSRWVETTAADFNNNGTPNGQVEIRGGSLRLRGNEGTLVRNGNFATTANWSLMNSPTGSVIASIGGGTGSFAHATVDNSSQFDSMDNSPDWGAATSGLGATSLLSSESTEKVEGSGSIGDTISLQNSGMWAGISRQASPPWDFRPYNRISAWLKTTYGGPGKLFAILHLESGFESWDSAAIGISTEWQRVDFPIVGFGSNLGAVNRIELRFTGAAIPLPGETVYIDDIWTRFFKVTNEGAKITQTITKTSANSGATGSANLTWQYDSPIVRNATYADLEIAVRHADGTNLTWTTPLQEATTWTDVSIDVSSVMAAPGTYTIEFTVRVRLDTYAPSQVFARIDSVVLLSPDYTNGWYESIPLSAGGPTTWDRVSWNEATDPETDIEIDLRSGGTGTVGDATWSVWTTYIDPGGEPIRSPPNAYLQFRIRLTTSNSTHTPVLDELRIDHSKFTEWGVVVTEAFDPPEDLIGWRWFDASATVPSGTAVSYAVSTDGGAWRPLVGADLGSFTGNTIRVQATLSTTNPLESPRLQSMRVTYEFRGALSIIQLSPGSWQGTADESVVFSASGYDAWLHPLVLTPIWETTDPGGTVDNGLYNPGRAGTWIVRARSPDRAIVGEVMVIVSPGTLQNLVLDPSAAKGEAGTRIVLTLSGYDAESNPITLSGTGWETTAGDLVDISASRVVLLLPSDPMKLTVTARNGAISTSAEIVVEQSLFAALVWPGSPIGIAIVAAALMAWLLYFRYPHTLEDVFVIARDGRLVVHQTRRLRADRDEDIFAAMLSAIMTFVRDSFKEEGKELDHFGFGNRTVYVERGNFGHVAAIYGGTAPPWTRTGLSTFVADLDQAHGKMILAWDGDGDGVHNVRAMTETFAKSRRYAWPWRRMRNRGEASAS